MRRPENDSTSSAASVMVGEMAAPSPCKCTAGKRLEASSLLVRDLSAARVLRRVTRMWLGPFFEEMVGGGVARMVE